VQLDTTTASATRALRAATHLSRRHRSLRAYPITLEHEFCASPRSALELKHGPSESAAPSRSPATVAGAARNLRALSRAAGTRPALENIATLMLPPASSMDEPEWVASIAATSGAPLLLDLHNLYANAVNFGHDPGAYLRRFPLERVSVVHISGGCWISEGRLLDDHLHDVPDPVYRLLEMLGEHCTQGLTVILERDGKFPSMSALIGQIQRARAAVSAGRRRVELAIA